MGPLRQAPRFGAAAVAPLANSSSHTSPTRRKHSTTRPRCHRGHPHDRSRTAICPGSWRDASAEIKNTVYLFEDLWSRSWPESPVSQRDRIQYASAEGRGQFDRAVADYLRGRTGGAETLRALDRFEYGGGCGNGASAFFESVSEVRLIASIRDGRVDADAAAAFVVGGSRPPDQLMAGADRRLLAAAGIDWEQLYLGAFLSGNAQHLDPLVRGGSDLTARLLLEFVGLGEADSEAPAVRALFPDALAFRLRDARRTL